MNSIQIIFALCLIFTASPIQPQVREGYLHIAEPGKIYSTTGKWKFHFGDNIKWADPGFDVSSWGTRTIPSDIKSPGGGAPGWFWCRLHFDVDKNVISQKPIFIAIPRCFHSYEVYFNGKKLGGRGQLPQQGKKWKWTLGGLYRIITPDDIYTEKNNVLAIRVYAGYSLLLLSMYTYGFISSFDLHSNFFLISTIFYFLLGAIVILIGIYHLFVFRKKEDNHNLRFALFAIFQGAYLIFLWLIDIVSSHSIIIFSFHTLFLILELMWIILFTYYFFEDRLRKYKKPVIALVAIMCCMLPVPLFSLLDLYRITYLILMIYGSILTPAFIYIITTEVIKGNNEIRPILYSTYFNFILIIIDVFQNLGVISIPVITFPWLLSSFGLVVFTIAVSISIGRRYSLFHNTKGEKEKRILHLKGMDLDAIETQLKKIMEEDRAYLDSDLSSKKLASMLSLTLHQLSEFLNTRLNISYNNYINLYRVEEAKRILLEDPSIPVINAAYKAGFNTISIFYKVFKKHTGVSPKEFRKKSVL